jgi:hypothetical protein
MVNPTPTSFYADGTVYDEAEVVTNDHPSSSQASVAPSSFFTDGGLVGAEDVTHSDVAPSDTPSPMPSSYFTDGGLVGAETVTNNDNVPDNSPRPAPTSFYPDGNLYDYLSQESEVVALLQQLAATTTTNANAAASSATNASTSATNAAASAAEAAAGVQGFAGTATPLIDGTAAVGTSTKWAHEDHVHPKDPTLASVSYVDTKVAGVVNSAPATLDTLNELATALGDDPHFATTVSAQIGTKAATTYVDAQDALKADKTYVDAQDALKADKASIGSGQCKLVYVDATHVKLIPFNGNQIKIAGALYSIPAAGITISNSGLVASNLFYIYATIISGALALYASPTGHATSTTAGNVGVETFSGNDAYTLVGMVYTNASAQFVDSPTNRQVRSWFNDFGVGVSSFQNGSSTTTTVGGYVELTTALRVTVLLWASEISNSILTAAMSNSGPSATYMVIIVNGGAVGQYAVVTTTALVGGTAQFNGSGPPSDQLVTWSIGGQVGAGTGNYQAIALTVSTIRR